MPSILCAYESDGATKKRDCPTHATACVPGCTPTFLTDWPADYWCTQPWSARSVGGNYSCPWRPTDLSTMLDSWHARRLANYTDCSPRCEERRARLSGDALKAFDERRLRFYSEVVLSRATVLQAMPHSVEAFFTIEDVNETECEMQGAAGGGDQIGFGRCEAFTREARRAFVDAFGLDDAHAPPVLRLRLRAMSEPFQE